MLYAHIHTGGQSSDSLSTTSISSPSCFELQPLLPYRLLHEGVAVEDEKRVGETLPEF